MTTEEQEIQEKISKIWKKTDIFLANHNNSLWLFDFTMVSHYESGGIHIKSIYQYKIKDYPEKLEEYFKEQGYSIPLESNDEPALYSISERNSILLNEPIPQIYDHSTITHKTVELDTWHQFVRENKMAGQCWTLFKYFFKNDETKERIEVGVYIFLENSFSSNGSNSEEVKNFLHYEVLKFLWDKGLEYFANKYIETIKRDSIADLVQTTYSLGHNLKNRLLGSDKLMEDLLQDIEESSLNEREKKDIKRYATNVSEKIKSLSNTGKILDLIGRFMTKKVWQEKWLSNSDYSFTEKIKNGEFTRVSISGKHAKIKMENFPPTLKLKGWLGDNGGYRPADFVYEELFFELLVNILTYGKAYVEADKKYVDVGIFFEGNKIIIVNIPNKKIGDNDKFKDLDKNISIKPTLIGHGGLLYMYKFLTQTAIGDIDIVLDEANNYFKIILDLKGICHDE